MHRFPRGRAVGLLGAAALVQAGVAPSSAGTATGPIAVQAVAAEPGVVRDWLVIAPLDRRGRRPFNPSALFAHQLLDPAATPPVEGGALQGELGVEQKWRVATADANGFLATDVTGAPIAAACARVEWPADGIALADLDGAGTVWVNGEPQVGDPYGYGFGGLPVAMRKGTNELFVTGMRGAFRLAFSVPPAPLIVNAFDATLPDLLVRQPLGLDGTVEVAIVVMNATDMPLAEFEVEGGADDEAAPFERTTYVERAGLPARGVQKVPLSIRRRAIFERPGQVELPIVVRAGALVARTTLSLAVKERAALQRRTRRSMIDDSVQEYAVLPPTGKDARGVVLTLHGAGVDAMGQAGSYAAKEESWIVAPTNRRPYGFDWQDWGRRDAYETLEEALFRFKLDRRRIGLTGHSMGGHGTWHLAANDPATFAAIAPSAGWSSFDSYCGPRPIDGLAALWHAADGAGRTLTLLDNLKQLPAFVLHGTADDNVPASEARLMLDALQAAGATPQSHFEEGAGHWWDGAASPGVDCVDWPAFFDLFRASERPKRVDRVAFTSNDPATQSSCDGVHVLGLLRYGEPFGVAATWDPATRHGAVTTRNVERLWLRTPDLEAVARWTIDGAEFPWTADAKRVGGGPEAGRDQQFVRNADRSWTAVADGDAPAPASWTTQRKLADRDRYPGDCVGPFKHAFENHFVLVYGTRGSATEDHELLARARFDAAAWWYRGNGRARIVSDVRWLELDHGLELLDEWDRPERSDRSPNVVLYGNRDTNAAWSALVPESAPFDAARGQLRLGEQRFEGDSLGACVVLPYGDSGLVGLFADSGARGTRVGYSLAPFISGVGYPDFALYSADVLTKGDDGVLAAGWFDGEWRIQQPIFGSAAGK